MKNRIKVFLATLAMILTFAMSYACTAYAGPALGFDTQTVVIETVETEKLAPQKSPAPVEETVANDPSETLMPELVIEEDPESTEVVMEEKKDKQSAVNEKPVTANRSEGTAEDLPFSVEGSVSHSMQNKQLEYWNRVPESVRNAFTEDGWEFVLTDKSIAGTYYGTELGSIAGLTNTVDKIIYIEDRENAIRRATVHEFGHYVDVAYGWISTSDEWIEIYRSEKDKLNEIGRIGDGHTTSSATEYFAEVFQQAINYPETCKESAPQSYEYIMGLLENFDDLNRATKPKENTPVITPEPTPTITASPTPVITPESTPVITPEPTAIVPPSIGPLVTPTPIPSPETTDEKNAEQEPEEEGDQENNIVTNPGQFETKNSNTTGTESHR